jgi:hypothetical protein
MLKKLIEILIYASAIFSFMAAMLLFMSYDSGWNKLAQYYKTDSLPPDDLLNKQNGKIGGYSCKQELNIGVSEQALYMSSDLSFFNMPPLLIPWNAVTHVRVTNNNFFGEGYKMSIGDPTIATLTLPKQALKQAEAILVTKQ